MTDQHLHIVCLDVPYPVDYGGVFDLFYKIKALHKEGLLIHLHCFEYGRGKQQELDKYCASVNYYSRKNFLKSFSFRVPFIVSSRANQMLLNNLSKDKYPILLEGIHCTYFLYSDELNTRKVFVRLHNVEYKYYYELSKSTHNIFKKSYFRYESLLLKKYEKAISNKGVFIAVSEKDKETYQKNFGAKNIKYLPAFIPFTNVTSKTGSGNFCLYHGNLSVYENEKATTWLIKNVFNSLNIPFVIAGKNPSKRLMAAAHSNVNICIVANPSAKEMDDLVKKAHIHILPSFNKTGIKIKLLNALFNGRHVITNPVSVEGNNLEAVCKIANTASDYKKIINELYHQPFTLTEADTRKKVLENIYENHFNALQLIRWIE